MKVVLNELISKAKRSKVLVLDADLSRAQALSHRLRFLNYDPVIANDSDGFDAASQNAGIAVVLGQADDPGLQKDVFHRVTKRRPDLPVLVFNSAGAAAEIGNLGNRPHWTLDSPVRRSQLTQLLKRAERYAGKERRQRITGNSRPIRQVRTQIEQVAGFCHDRVDHRRIRHR